MGFAVTLSRSARPRSRLRGQGSPWYPVQRACRRRRPDRLRPCLQDGARRNRVEAEGFGLPFRTLARLAQEQDPAPAVKREADEDWGKRR
jgi:hypothetical protein